MTDARKSRTSWIEASLAVIGEHGVDRVKVEPLAKRLGVTKGSFYWHFKDRAELLAATVEHWERTRTQGIIDRVQAGGGDAAERLLRLFKVALDNYAPQEELALREWARRDESVAEPVARVDRRRMDFLRQLLSEIIDNRAEVEARALMMYSLLIGNFFIDVPHGRFGRPRILQECLALLTQGGQPD